MVTSPTLRMASGIGQAWFISFLMEGLAKWLEASLPEDSMTMAFIGLLMVRLSVLESQHHIQKTSGGDPFHRS